MSQNVGTIYYEVDAKTDPLVSSSAKAFKSLDQLEEGLAQTDKTAASTAKTLNTTVGGSLGAVTGKADTATKSVSKLASSVTTVKSSATSTAPAITNLTQNISQGSEGAERFAFNLTGLAKALAAVAVSKAVTDIAGMVQKYQEMAERVQMATASQEEFQMVQERLLATANGTYRSLQEAQELYITTADSLRSMGYSTGQAVDVTDSMSYAFVKNATSADRAQAAIDAFAKSINTGKVAADQWETISSALPSVIGDIAAASGKTSAEIRALGAAGKLTATQLSEGLRKSLDANAAAAAAMSNNLIDAAVRSRTAITAFFVEAEKQSGVLDNLTKGIILAADALLKFSTDSEGVSTAITAASSAAGILAVVIAAKLAGAAAGYIKTQAVLLNSTLLQIGASQRAAAAEVKLAEAQVVQAQAALKSAQAAEAAAVGLTHHAQAANALAVAQAEATVATTRLDTAMAVSASTATRTGVAMTGLKNIMGFLGGPVGVILIAASALYYFSQAATETKVNVDSLNQSLSTLTFNQLVKSANDVEDDIQKVENRLERLQNVAGQKQTFLETDDSFTKRMQENAAAIDTENQNLEKLRGSLVKIADAQRKVLDTSVTPETPVKADANLKDDTGAATVIKGLEDELALLKVIGVERAKLKAIQKLGDNASPAQRLEAEKLAASIFALEEAEKKQKATSKKLTSDADAAAKKSAAEQKKGIEQNIKAFADMGVALASVDKTARELAQDQAQLTLNKWATPEQIATIRAQAAALYDLQGAQKLLSSVDPIAGANIDYTNQFKELEAARQQDLISQERYTELKTAMERGHLENIRALQEENFRAQATGNALLLDGIDAVGQMGGSTITGLLTKTLTWQDALGNIASTVANSIVNSFVQMGVDWVKQQIIMAAATRATETAQVAGIGTVTAAQTAATATIAGTTTATAATTGAAVATSMAPAAGLSSIASFGSAAVIGGAALLGTMLLAKSFGGGRRAGGDVAANKVYRVNEGGAPEIFNAGGQQYMIPNQRGQVVSNGNAQDQTAGGSSLPPIVNVNNYGSEPAQVESRFSAADERWVIDVTAGNVMNGGKLGRAVNSTTGTSRSGS